MCPLISKNVVVNNSKTTIALEAEYWKHLATICLETRVTLSVLVNEIDSTRGRAGRASAIRVYVLNYFCALSRVHSTRPEVQRLPWGFDPFGPPKNPITKQHGQPT